MIVEARKKTASLRETLVVNEGSSGAPRQHLRPSPTYVYFDAVARHGSIRKAADALHIASSALNRRILDLEDEVGSPLFERLPRGVRLTAAGELFLTYVRRSLKELRVLEAQIEGLRTQTHGTVRIAVAESVTCRLLPGAISNYQKTHPGVCFHVTVDGPERLSELLVKDSVDLILTHELPEKPTVSVLAAASHPLCALVAPGHPLAERDAVQLSDCAAYPLAMPDHTLAARVHMDLALEHSSVSFAPALVSNSIETLKTFARLNEGVCFSFHLGDEAEKSGLVALRLRDPYCSQGRLYLAARRGRVLPVAAASFAEELKDVLPERIFERTISAV
jgi:DNA-binding transcriptional LysR family regulator